MLDCFLCACACVASTRPCVLRKPSSALLTLAPSVGSELFRAENLSSCQSSTFLPTDRPLAGQEAAETVLQTSLALSPPSSAAASGKQEAAQQLPQSAPQAFQQCMEAASKPAVCGQGARTFIASVIGPHLRLG